MKKNFLVLAYFLFIGQFIFAQKPFSKIEEGILEKANQQKQLECLVILNEQADVSLAENLATKEAKGEFVFSTLKKHAQKSQARLIAFLQNEKIEYQQFLIVNAVWVKTSLENIRNIADFQEVLTITDNPWLHFENPISHSLTPNEGDRSIEWNLNLIKADSVWATGNRGQGAVIGGQDTGYQWDHPALKKAYRGYIDSTKTDHSYSWHDAIHFKSPLSKDSLNPCGFNTIAPCDDHSHGTHTMGTMVGDDGLGNQIGVAPAAKWIACRNMERGNGSPTTYIESFEWFLAPTDKNGKNPLPKKAPHVINNSWYCSPEEGCNSTSVSALMEIAVKNLKAAGIVVVIASGNFGPNCETIPEAASAFESGFTIGATDANDALASFSSRGPKVFGTWLKAYIKPNVVAPGAGIRSCVPGNQYAAGWSGTSMAAPHVAGVVALMITANPKLAGQVHVIEDILEKTAQPIITTDSCGGVKGNVFPNFNVGYGRINALKAVQAAKKQVTANKEVTQNTDFQVFPNPFIDFLTIKNKEEASDFEISIFDIYGKKVFYQKEKNSSQSVFSLEILEKGAYFYEVRNEKGVNSGKIWKVR